MMSDQQDSTAPAAPAYSEPLSTAFIPPPPPAEPAPPPPPLPSPGTVQSATDAELVLEPTSPTNDPAALPAGERAPAWTDPNFPVPAPIDPPDPLPPDPPPFMPTPQPPMVAPGQPDVQAAIALSDDPATKLRAFLSANPDVVTYIDENIPPAPEPQA